MKRKGWFSVEFAVCIVVLLILMAFFLPKSLEFMNQGRVSKAQGDLSSLGVAVSQYAFEVGEYPAHLSDLTVIKGQYGPWLPEIKKDPWGNDYQYKFDKKDGFIVYSFGSDGIDSGSTVKTVNPNDVGYIGK